MKVVFRAALPVTSALVLVLCCSVALAQHQFGEVSFQNSGPAAAQSDFLLGLSQLHNFEYDDALASFRRAEHLAPDFAMAYWGEAMTKNHAIWHEQDLAGAREVLARLGATPEARLAKAPTEREKLYLQSLEVLYGDGEKDERDKKYEAAMADLHRQFPDDVNATSFYALAILGTAEQGRNFATYMRAAAVLEEVFPQNPNHPGVIHYLIHCYDDPIHAPLGLRPARIYAKVAPGAGHAQHMTSHIFLALGMWDDVVTANETAVGVVNRKRAAAGKTPRFCGHYNSWLVYGYLQQGRTTEARRVLAGCRIEADNQSNKSFSSPDPDNSSIASYADMRAHFLIDSQLWDDDVAHWQMPAGGGPFSQFAFDYTNALVAFKKGDFSTARELSSRVESDRKLGEAWLHEHKWRDPNDGKRLAIMSDQLSAVISSQNANGGETVRLLQQIADQERGLPMEFGPPAVLKPTDELLGEILLQLHNPAEARRAFEADLARAPGRRLAVQGLTDSKNELAAIPPVKDTVKEKSVDNQDHHH